jgi:hypothetical protein
MRLALWHPHCVPASIPTFKQDKQLFEQRQQINEQHKAARKQLQSSGGVKLCRGERLCSLVLHLFRGNLLPFRFSLRSCALKCSC